MDVDVVEGVDVDVGADVVVDGAGGRTDSCSSL